MFVIYLILLIVGVVGGHLFFAYSQWTKWPKVCEKLTDFTPDEVQKTAFLGRSIASYNASIGVGLLLSFLLDDGASAWIQGVALILIMVTAMVGNSGTRGNSILITRLLPAALALVALVLVSL